jgi:heparan-alpha-glucosaminide N-acetyltransferase
MNNGLTTQRILSIDALRGITILTMIFVNELAGVHGIPAWMKHMPGDADGMTFVDAVFPAFLFIVGMSIPFAIANRKAKGDNTAQLQAHILFRTLGLLVLGVFMVNAEGDYNDAAMPIPIGVWSLLFYVAVILIWNVYNTENKVLKYGLRATGVILLVVLAFIYRGGDDGTAYMKPHWWGILGLIGWAYLLGCICYQVFRGSLVALSATVVFCIVYYALGRTIEHDSPWHAVFSQGGHASHTSLVLMGIILSLIFFHGKAMTIPQRFNAAAVYAVALIVGGVLLRPYFKISKIHATPSWCLFSAAACVVIFSFLYWLIDLKKISGWTNFIKPAASNPLLTYIIPFVVSALMEIFHLHWPSFLGEGFVGILWSLLFAVAVMSLVPVLNRMKIRLQL